MHFNYEILVRFLLAALWGGIVGAERQYRSKSAGFRTMIMISMGACFFTMMSVLIGEGSNPDRIASNIVTGIGFLGAGVIFRGENRINGITTAATIWAVAAVGMGIGSGFYFASACASILIVLILAALPYLENVIERMNQSRTYLITAPYAENLAPFYEKEIVSFHLRCRLIKQLKQDDQLQMIWETQGHAGNHETFIKHIIDQPGITRFEYY